MNSPKAAQARTAAPQAALPHSYPTPWFSPSSGFCMPWILRKVQKHKLSAGGRGFPGFPTGSCSCSCENAQNFGRLKVTATFYFCLMWKVVLLKAERTASARASQKSPESPPPTDTWPIKAPLPSRCCLRNTGSIQGKTQGSSCSPCLLYHTPKGCSRDHWTRDRAAFDLISVLRDKINHFVTMSLSSGDAQDLLQAPPESDHKQGLVRSCTSSGHIWMSPLFLATT